MTIKDHPILFRPEMVRAILDGRKMQTRRIMKPQPPKDVGRIEVGLYHPTVMDRHGDEQPGEEVFGAYDEDGGWGARCPYGQPGDRLISKIRGGKRWTAPREAPPRNTVAWASRLTLEITEVRVERVQDISEADAKAEGVEPIAGSIWLGAGMESFHDHLMAFKSLWNRMHDKDGFGWSANPFVWCISFKVVK